MQLSSAPEAIFAGDDFAVYPDSIIMPGGGVLTASAPLAIDSREGGVVWHADTVRRAYPLYASEQTLVDALYNHAIEAIACTPSGNTTTAAMVWDIDAALSVAAPREAMRRLRRMIGPDGTLRQGGGAGGAWPVVGLHAIWASAAWEVYVMTGDRKWLAEAFATLETTLRTDKAVLTDPTYGLMHGAQLTGIAVSGYSQWMTPADIYESMTATTNVTYAHAFGVAAMMASELGKPDGEYSAEARRLRTAVNERLWIPQTGYYSRYLYGSPYALQSQATDNLASAFAVVHDVATPEMKTSVMLKAPRYATGIPFIYPCRSITPKDCGPQPLVQAYWSRAAAHTQNSAALEWSIAASMLMQAESVVTSPDSARIGAAASGVALAAAICRGIMGLRPEAAALSFAPIVPPSLPGTKWLSGVCYRGARLDVSVSGYGTRIASFKIDGRESHTYAVDSGLTGRHTVEIVMANNKVSSAPTRFDRPALLPAPPQVEWTSPRDARLAPADASAPLRWQVYVNADQRGESADTVFELFDSRHFTTVAFAGVGPDGAVGDVNAPHSFYPRGSLLVKSVEYFDDPYSETLLDESGEETSESPLILTSQLNTQCAFEVTVPEGADYYVSAIYSNGNGPVWSGRCCALRALFVNGIRAGILVMPQLGKGDWKAAAASNMLPVRLNGGRNTLSIDYVEPFCANTDGQVNSVMLRNVQFVKR